MRKQFNKTKEEYFKWLHEHDIDDLEKMQDFPDIQVKVPRDEAETNLVSDEW